MYAFPSRKVMKPPSIPFSLRIVYKVFRSTDLGRGEITAALVSSG